MTSKKAILERTAHTCPVMYSIHPDLEVKVEFKMECGACAFRVKVAETPQPPAKSILPGP